MLLRRNNSWLCHLVKQARGRHGVIYSERLAERR